MTGLQKLLFNCSTGTMEGFGDQLYIVLEAQAYSAGLYEYYSVDSSQTCSPVVEEVFRSSK